MKDNISETLFVVTNETKWVNSKIESIDDLRLGDK